jgi:tellurium resistance protein TerD
MIIGCGSTDNTSPQGGVINLSKGGKVNLSKEAPGLKKIMVGLGWDCQKYSGQDDFDLDASCFLVDYNGKTKESGFVFYNNLVGPNGCVKHQGDNRTGGDDGDDEQIYIDLDLIPEYIEKIAITVTIDGVEEGKKHQNFGMVSNAYCRLVNTETDKEQIHFDLGEDFSNETAIVVGEVYRHNGDWKFNAIGSGFDGGLKKLCANYGLAAEYD